MSSSSNSPAGSVVPETSRVRTSRQALVCGCNGARHHHHHVCLLDLMWRWKICVCWTFKMANSQSKERTGALQAAELRICDWKQTQKKAFTATTMNWTAAESPTEEEEAGELLFLHRQTAHGSVFSPSTFFLFKDPSLVCNSLSIVMQLWWRVTLLRATYTTVGWQ